MLTPPIPEQVPCPVEAPGQWHEYHAARHRARLPTTAEPAAEPGAEPGALITAGAAWHRGWAEWHEQQAAKSGDEPGTKAGT